MGVDLGPRSLSGVWCITHELTREETRYDWTQLGRHNIVGFQRHGPHISSGRVYGRFVRWQLGPRFYTARLDEGECVCQGRCWSSDGEELEAFSGRKEGTGVARASVLPGDDELVAPEANSEPSPGELGVELPVEAPVHLSDNSIGEGDEVHGGTADSAKSPRGRWHWLSLPTNEKELAALAAALASAPGIAIDPPMSHMQEELGCSREFSSSLLEPVPEPSVTQQSFSRTEDFFGEFHHPALGRMWHPMKLSLLGNGKGFWSTASNSSSLEITRRGDRLVLTAGEMSFVGVRDADRLEGKVAHLGIDGGAFRLRRCPPLTASMPLPEACQGVWRGEVPVQHCKGNVPVAQAVARPSDVPQTMATGSARPRTPSMPVPWWREPSPSSSMPAPWWREPRAEHPRRRVCSEETLDTLHTGQAGLAHWPPV